ncbi:MAG: hypothetical protein IPI10_18610 [Bacteroidetes bacterium]|nr:hypothetical protein [Bacteroidota bacterium]
MKVNEFDLFLIRTNDSEDIFVEKNLGLQELIPDYIAIGRFGYFLASGTNGAGVGGDVVASSKNGYFWQCFVV